MVILSYDHYRKRRYRYSHFWLQVSLKSTNWIFYLFTKGRRDKINESKAMTFDDGRACNAQTSVAPSKHLFIDFTSKCFCEKLMKIFFRRQKMKCCKSSETRFPKVSRRSEPSSGGKRPFEIFTFFVCPSVCTYVHTVSIRPFVRPSVRLW